MCEAKEERTGENKRLSRSLFEKSVNNGLEFFLLLFISIMVWSFDIEFIFFLKYT